MPLFNTKEEEKVYNYYKDCKDMREFAKDWCDFCMYINQNVIEKWYNWLDEFVEWAKYIEDDRFDKIFQGE